MLKLVTCFSNLISYMWQSQIVIKQYYFVVYFEWIPEFDML